jgi:uncharacterized membrane protein
MSDEVAADPTALAEEVDILAQVPLFALLDATERAALASRVEHLKFPADKLLFGYGDPGDALYIVLSGEVEVFSKHDTGEKIVLEVVREGGFFGEISLLDEGPRTASAQTMTPVEALVVDRDDIKHLLKTCPGAALDLLAATGRRLRETAKLLRRTTSRNVNEEEEDRRSTVAKIADTIADFSGSLPFLFIHIAVFAIWILLNWGPLAKPPVGGWDPFPFGFLTMCVSLEAIILSVFVLLSQNRQVARDRVRNDIEYAVNLKAELEIAHLHEKFDDVNSQMTSRLAEIERALGVKVPHSRRSN